VRSDGIKIHSGNGSETIIFAGDGTGEIHHKEQIFPIPSEQIFVVKKRKKHEGRQCKVVALRTRQYGGCPKGQFQVQFLDTNQTAWIALHSIEPYNAEKHDVKEINVPFVQSILGDNQSREELVSSILSKSLSGIKDLYELHSKLIQLLEEHKQEDGICHVSQTVLAKHFNCSYTLVGKRLERLRMFDDCVEQVKPGQYVVRQKDMMQYGLFAHIVKYLLVWKQSPEFRSMNQLEQATAMGIPIHKLQVILGYAREAQDKTVSRSP